MEFPYDMVLVTMLILCRDGFNSFALSNLHGLLAHKMEAAEV